MYCEAENVRVDDNDAKKKHSSKVPVVVRVVSRCFN